MFNINYDGLRSSLTNLSYLFEKLEIGNNSDHLDRARGRNGCTICSLRQAQERLKLAWSMTILKTLQGLATLRQLVPRAQCERLFFTKQVQTFSPAGAGSYNFNATKTLYESSPARDTNILIIVMLK